MPGIAQYFPREERQVVTGRVEQALGGGSYLVNVAGTLRPIQYAADLTPGNQVVLSQTGSGFDVIAQNKIQSRIPLKVTIDG